MYFKKKCSYKLKKARYVYLFFLITMFCCSYGMESSINILGWWGYLDSPVIAREVKNKCGVNISYDTYYTNNEFLRRLKANNVNYDIIIFSQTIYDVVKNEIPSNNVNLAKFSDKFNPIVRREYLKRKFPRNVIYFMHSLTGFLWNPEAISLTKQDTLKSIFSKAKDNIVVIIDDPLEIWNLIDKAYDPSSSNRPSRIKSAQLTASNFKNLVQKSKVYMSNNYNQIYYQENFAFAFAWSGDAIFNMKQSKKRYNFMIHPKLSYISSDLLSAMNEAPKTICVANMLLSRETLDIIQQRYSYFSPYGDYQSVKDPVYQSIYKDVFNRLSTIPWLETSLTTTDFEKMVETWNEIHYEIRNN